MIQYSDFECPFSARFFEKTSPTIVQTYVNTGKVLLAFRHLPLDRIHPSARKAAEAAECSARQGKFWAMHDQLFATPRSLDSDGIFVKAERIGLDSGRFRRCMMGEAAAQIQRDVEEARKLSITGTPAFLFGTVEQGGRLKVVRHESGALPTAVFARILDELLQAVTSAKP